jgi:hypothetical protein
MHSRVRAVRHAPAGSLAGAARLLVSMNLTLVFFGALTVLAIYDAQGNDPVVPQPGTLASAVVIVQNTVVAGPAGMVPDDYPVYLSTRPTPRCALHDCEISGTQRDTGGQYLATCFVLGEGMTNMNVTARGANRNPARVSSDLWYGVPVHDRSLGYVSEAYLIAEHRGGLGLRRC